MPHPCILGRLMHVSTCDHFEPELESSTLRNLPGASFGVSDETLCQWRGTTGVEREGTRRRRVRIDYNLKQCGAQGLC